MVYNIQLLVSRSYFDAKQQTAGMIILFLADHWNKSGVHFMCEQIVTMCKL